MTKISLSDHFTLAEFTRTNTGLANVPANDNIHGNLILLADLMEGVRKTCGGYGVLINSAYRSPAVNAKVGGSESSQHMKGEACDFTIPAFGTPFHVCAMIIAMRIPFDQLIYEQTWVHISRSAKPRGEVLTFRNGTYSKGLIP